MEDMEKEAWSRKMFGLLAIPTDNAKMIAALAALAGITTGAVAGTTASMVKTRNDEAVSLMRRKGYYDKKVEEMRNANMLNEVLSIRRKLESGRLPPDERSRLEKRYVKLIDDNTERPADVTVD